MSDEQKNNDWKERELGALWVKKSLNGTQYMTGHIELRDASGKVQLVVLQLVVGHRLKQVQPLV